MGFITEKLFIALFFSKLARLLLVRPARSLEDAGVVFQNDGEGIGVKLKADSAGE
ncbi:MAG: hypothetical protein AAFX93_19210 [Verrucomicrobiota bacterium]